MLGEPGAVTIAAYAIVGLDECGLDHIQGVAIGKLNADYHLEEIRAAAVEAIESDDALTIAQAEAIAASIRLLSATVTITPDPKWSNGRDPIHIR